MVELTADTAIIGAGPAGLSAAIEAGKYGAEVLLIDENGCCGGQLYKQIHKFFGTHNHMAGMRGFNICKALVEQLEQMKKVKILLNTTAYGVFGKDTIGVFDRAHNYEVRARKYILAAGGRENYLSFPGSTLPGVMGAGAAQTMTNVHHVLPGEKVVMVGSGNVGLIVAYQLLQAGAKIQAIVEASPQIGGYGVHAAKLLRQGIPILTSHTVVKAMGDRGLEKIEISEVDQKFRPIKGKNTDIECDTLCLAVGLTPMSELAWMAGCAFGYDGNLGGQIPLHDRNMQTTNPSFYVAGDICGIEEASTAMEEGRLAGCAVAEALGLLAGDEAEKRKKEIWGLLDMLRTGPFGVRRKTGVEQLIASYQNYTEMERISYVNGRV